MNNNTKSSFNNKVVLGLSGGVDSTAAALLLKEQGYEVTGLYFDNLGNNKSGIKKAKKVASELSIHLAIKDVSDIFRKEIISNFINEYSCGRTPNPCILCNPMVKFHTLISYADEIGASYIATGHYARVEYSSIQNCDVIKMALNRKKDQSYMLYRLPKSIIERIIFPLSSFYDKEQTREIARDNNLSNSEDKDSQEICFLNNNETYVDFLLRNGINTKEGSFIDKDNNVLGKHKGIMHYTIGQRKGLGITLGKPAFVTKIDSKNNTVTLGDNSDLFLNEITCNNAFFTSTSNNKIPEFVLDRKLLAKVRYAAMPSSCTLTKDKNNKIKVIFDEPQRAATNGQSLVLYLDDEVIGGGIIDM